MTQKVKYRLEFEVSDSWKASESACWTECPFSPLIGLGHTCKFLTTKELKCPFRDNKFKTLIERDCTVEVRHGKWLTWEEQFPDRKPTKKNNLGVFCNNCHSHADNMTDYCPNCGARMDGETE